MVSAAFVYYFLFHPGYDIVAFVIDVVSYPAIVWGVFWLGILVLLFKCDPPHEKLCMFMAIPLGLLAGDIAHGWLNYYSLKLILLAFTLCLYSVTMLSWWAYWMLQGLLGLVVAVVATVLAVILILTVIILFCFMVCGYSPRDTWNSLVGLILCICDVEDDANW